MEYKFLGGPEEDKKPLEERTIHKTGITADFRLVEMYGDIRNFQKTLKELTGNRDLKDAIVKNLEQHHPHLKGMPELERYTVHMYQENWAMRKAYDEKITEIQKQFDEFLEEYTDILEQIPELKKTISPFEIVNGKVIEKPNEQKKEKPAPEKTDGSVKNSADSATSNEAGAKE